VESGHVAGGTAQTATATGELPGDGTWELEPGPSAEYRTRVVVRRAERAEDFSGVVLLEWLDVSGGVDADPEWTTLREEVGRQGHVCIGVSAQALGIEGGDVRVRVSDVEGSDAAGKGLRAIDPERYGDLEHPGDAYAYDIFSQVGRAVRAGIPALDDLDPEHLVAAGESQSAMALVTYVNAFHPDAEVFDAFYVHSRGASGLPIPAPGENADIASAVGSEPTMLRTDHDAPIIVLPAENDVTGLFGGVDAHQPDSDTFRLWEVAGTAHADRRLMGEDTADSIDCGAPINDGPLHVVAKAALRHLVTPSGTRTASPPAASARPRSTSPSRSSPGSRARTGRSSASCPAPPSRCRPSASPSCTRTWRRTRSSTRRRPTPRSKPASCSTTTARRSRTTPTRSSSPAEIGPGSTRRVADPRSGERSQGDRPVQGNERRIGGGGGPGTGSTLVASRRSGCFRSSSVAHTAERTSGRARLLGLTRCGGATSCARNLELGFRGCGVAQAQHPDHGRGAVESTDCRILGG